MRTSDAGSLGTIWRRRRAAVAWVSIALLALHAFDSFGAENHRRFGAPRADLRGAERERIELGRALFDTRALAKSEPGAALVGLGPVYNMEGCGGCHIRDGRGRPPLVQGEALRQMVVRLSVRMPDGAVMAHPVYGTQLNDQAIEGVPAEGQAFVEYSAVTGRYGDGTPYELARPHYGFFELAFGRLGDEVLISARVPPHVVGLGLIEAVSDGVILALADEDDADGDGISGRPNRVTDVATGRLRLGRFGWKASQPTLRQQSAEAARTDMGLTSTLYAHEDCAPMQRACAASSGQGRPELGDAALDALEAYLKGLGAPLSRGSAGAGVATGQGLFADYGCARCHVPSLKLERAALPGAVPAAIAVYSDLLLHDMGEGLADHRPDGLANGSEWRTAPLWGLGLTEPINGHTRFLHDGRARNLEEAILWHGGEAEPAKERFRLAPADDRAALLTFLNSL